MYIGCINKNNTAYGNKASMKVYRFKIYNGSTLAHDFIPVQRISDKVLGLYDLKTSTFKTNLGSGVFTSNLMNDPSSLAYFNGDSLQSQGNLSLTITNNNVTLSNEQTHFGKNSLKFNGSSSYMYMPFPSTYTGDITIEGWFYQTSNNNTSYPTPFTLISSAGRGMYMHRLSSQTFVAATPSNSWPGLDGGTPALNTWTHIAMCLSGTTTYCFLDGKLKGTLTNTNTSYVGLTLGTLAESASNNHQSGCYYKGYIAELKVSKGCKWTKDFTLPATPYSTAKDSNPWKEPVQMFVNTGASTTVPSGLVELEYIKPNSTQYINTQFIPAGNTRVIFTFEPTIADNQALYTGGRTAASGTDAKTFSAFYISKAIRRDYYGTSKTTTTTYDINTKITVDANKNTTLINNSSALTDFTLNTSTTSIMPIILFIAANQSSSSSTIQVSSSGAQYKFYSCKIYDNDTLVRDFVPAKRMSDDKCGLWDKVNLKFYTDENGGNFTAGTEKDSIATIGTSLEYIQSSGTQYIDTGLKPTQNYSITIKCQSTGTSNNTYAGCDTNWRNTGFFIGVNVFEFGNVRTTSIQNYGENPIILTLDKTGGYKDGVKTWNNASTATFQTVSNLTLFALNRNGTIQEYLTGKIYSCKIYDNDTLVRDFIPVKTTTNIYGLWDKVNKVFYKNAGTGTFTGGPAVALTGWHKIKGIWAKINGTTWKQVL